MKIPDAFSAMLQSQYTLWVAAAFAAAVLLFNAAWFGWISAFLASSWLWPTLALLLAVLIFVAIRWGLPRFQEQRFVRSRSLDAVIAGQETPEELRERFQQAVQKIRDLPQFKEYPQSQRQEDPLYALPWHLMIGESSSGKTEAITGAGRFSPLIPPLQGSGTLPNCDWWVSTNAIVIDTAGRYTTQTDVARDRTDWYWVLHFLRQYRERLPVNGVIVALPVDRLLPPNTPEHIRLEASKLRERLEEVMTQLGIDVPVYLLLTKCDAIEGFTEFFASLPEYVFKEALGYVQDPPFRAKGDDPQSTGSNTLRQQLLLGLESIYQRLHFFRLSLLREKTERVPDAIRPAIFCFPEEIHALQIPLIGLLETLFNVHPGHPTPLWRGLFFTSTRRQGASSSLLRHQLHLPEATTPPSPQTRPHFLHDLFAVTLSRDRFLARLTMSRKRRTLIRRSSWAFLVLGGICLLSFFLLRGFFLDRHLVASTDIAACPEGTPAISDTPQISAISKCRETVQTLLDANAQRPQWTSVFFRRSFQLAQDMQQRYVNAFRRTVQEPLSKTLEQVLAMTSTPVPLLLTLVQRIQLNRQCGGTKTCTRSEIENMPLDYAILVSPQSTQQPPPQMLEQLRQATLAYLLWQPLPHEASQQDLLIDQKRLQHWMSNSRFNPDQLLPWLNKRASPLKYETYWQLPPPATLVSSPRIDGGCTQKVWQQQLAPFLQQLQDAAPGTAQQVLEFRQRYLDTCFSQWRRFVAAFPKDSERWWNEEARWPIAQRLLKESSPYQMVLKETVDNLEPWLPQDDKEPGPYSWPLPLQAYVRSPQWQQYQDMLKTVDQQLGPTPSPEVCFKMAQAVFSAGEPKQDAGHPLLQAWWLASQPSAITGSVPQTTGNPMLSPLLQAPVTYVWRAILAETEQYLAMQWEETTKPLAHQQPAERFLSLFGKDGKVQGFAQQFAQLFLSPETPQARTLLGETPALPPQFLQLLPNAKSAELVFKEPFAVLVKPRQRSAVAGRASPVGRETVLSVSCTTKISSVSDLALGENTTILWTYEGCTDTKIAVAIDEPGQSPQFTLIKHYPGSLGFLRFVQDFLDGEHDFSIEELESTDPSRSDVRRSGVSSIHVYYSVEAPALAKLLKETSAAG